MNTHLTSLTASAMTTEQNLSGYSQAIVDYSIKPTSATITYLLNLSFTTGK